MPASRRQASGFSPPLGPRARPPHLRNHHQHQPADRQRASASEHSTVWMQAEIAALGPPQRRPASINPPTTPGWNERRSYADDGPGLRRIGKAGVCPSGPRHLLLAPEAEATRRPRSRLQETCSHEPAALSRRSPSAIEAAAPGPKQHSEAAIGSPARDHGSPGEIDPQPPKVP